MKNARILDATASNRSIWLIKDSPHILFIDIENELQVPPDMVLDCTETGFKPHSYHTIFFDPPQWWGDTPSDNYYSCKNLKESKAFSEKYGYKGYFTSYYGTDKFKSKTELLTFLHKSQKEFNRILKDDGMLWVKWNETKIPLSKILPFFKNWDEMLRLEIGDNYQTLGVSQTYWMMFMKKEGIKQTDLNEVEI